jgi:AraC family transcriptional regulator
MPPATDSQRLLLEVLVHVQTNLDADLSLESLAAIAQLSRSRFHRVFRDRVGETPKQYTQRLRLERAAIRLHLLRTTILETAFAVGFQSHETFTRAFQRHFDVLPSLVQEGGMLAIPSARPPESARSLSGPDDRFTLSAIKIVTLKPMDLAFIRHIGPYEAVPDGLFGELQAWAQAQGFHGYRPLLGIGHDAPGITPPDKLRFDAAIRVDGPIRSNHRVGHQVLPEGRYAVATHVGHYATLPTAYGELFGRIAAMPNVHPAGPPAIEMYHENRIDADLLFNHTDIYLPVIPKTNSSVAQ